MAHLSSNERQEIEDYLKQYSIEACLDEAINEVVEKRPENPYMAIAQCMEAKTLPEIMDVYIYSKIVGEGRGGVEAIVETNIGKFRSLVTIPASTESGEVMRDFSIIREKIRESLRRQDPKNLSEIDSTLLKIPGIEPPISLAVSIACCRAGARHRAMPLYKYLAESAGTPSGLCIPVPSVSVLSRVSAEGKPEQEISLLPISSNDLDFALDAMLQCLAVVETKVSSLGLPFSRSRNGCICVQTPTIGEALEVCK
jgi:enolase